MYTDTIYDILFEETRLLILALKLLYAYVCVLNETILSDYGGIAMLSDLYVMKVDAKKELDNMNSNESIDRFKESILVPEGISIDSLLDGNRYFLIGEKGAGKTALLIYSALKAEELYEAEYNFIIFKEFSQEEREDYTALAHITKYAQSEVAPCLEYDNVWFWLFHNTIVDTIKCSRKLIFVPNEDLETYISAVDAIKTYPRGSGKKMPIITKDGYVKADIDFPVGVVNTKLSGKISFERNPKRNEEIRFSTHINELNRLFSALNAGDSLLFIVVDELNISRINAEEYERDVIMIRDMVIAIDRFNAMTKNAHDNVRIISSVRNEVVNSIKARGKEINKTIESYGIPIDWTIYAQEDLKHPLIKLLINYFRISDLMSGTAQDPDDHIEYNRWVEERIDGYPSEQMIRNITLYRPRHIVRLLNLSKTLCGNHSRISGETIEIIKRRYSRECWNEVVEELVLSYSTNEMELIKEWLTGMPYETKYSEMYDKANAVWKGTPEGKRLLSRFDEILRDLYYYGVIGNIIRYSDNTIQQRWYFRGDDSLLKNQKIIIHNIFAPVLSTTKPE